MKTIKTGILFGIGIRIADNLMNNVEHLIRNDVYEAKILRYHVEKIICIFQDKPIPEKPKVKQKPVKNKIGFQIE